MEITRADAREKLSRFREKTGITQEKLSEKTGVSVPTIIGIESGRKIPQAGTIFKLNTYFKTIPDSE